MQNRLWRFWRETARHWWYDYEWPVIGALAMAVVALGCWGFYLQILEFNLKATADAQKPV